jgi:hypothetical protein
MWQWFNCKCLPGIMLEELRRNGKPSVRIGGLHAET